MDLDVNTDLGGRTYLIVNYGYARPRFQDAGDVMRTSHRVPRHTANVWLRRDWASGVHAGIGARHVGSLFANLANTVVIEGHTLFSGAVGYRARDWEWTLNAENLFNRKGYFLPGHFGNLVFPGQPLTVISSIRLRLR